MLHTQTASAFPSLTHARSCTHSGHKIIYRIIITIDICCFQIVYCENVIYSNVNREFDDSILNGDSVHKCTHASGKSTMCKSNAYFLFWRIILYISYMMYIFEMNMVAISIYKTLNLFESKRKLTSLKFPISFFNCHSIFISATDLILSFRINYTLMLNIIHMYE